MNQIIQYRDKFILYILAGLGVCRMTDISFLAGFINASHARRRVAFLIRQGLIASEYWGHEKIYYLTSKGYLETERLRKTYTVNANTTHDIGIARICTYLYLTKNVSYYDFMTDRQMFYRTKSSGIHRPDLVLDGVCYEYERSLKNKKLLKKNILTNTKFKSQVWIMHDENIRLKRNVEEIISSEMIENINIVSFEAINDYVLSADISKNKMRSKPCRGERDFEILLDESNYKNDKFDFYYTNRRNTNYDF